MAVAKALPKDLVDSLLSGYKKPEDLIGEHGLLKQLTKVLVERALEAEMEAHLVHAKNEIYTEEIAKAAEAEKSRIEALLRIPEQTGHAFHGKLDSHSRANWTLIPGQTGQ